MANHFESSSDRENKQHTIAQQEAFQAALLRWMEHIDANADASNMRVYVMCDAFEELVEMGPAITPLIIEHYVDLSVPYSALLKRLHPDAPCEEGLLGNLQQVRSQWLLWYESAFAR